MNVSRRVIISLSLAFAIRVYLETLTPLKSMETLTLIIFFPSTFIQLFWVSKKKKKLIWACAPAFWFPAKQLSPVKCPPRLSVFATYPTQSLRRFCLNCTPDRKAQNELTSCYSATELYTQNLSRDGLTREKKVIRMLWECISQPHQREIWDENCRGQDHPCQSQTPSCIILHPVHEQDSIQH